MKIEVEQKTEVFITDWKRSFSNPKALKVAIARKCPRLCELEGIEDVISEHALPFVLPRSNHKIIYVADEAIYHGTTFSRIYNVVRTGALIRQLVRKEGVQPPQPVKAVPAAISSEALSRLKGKIEFLTDNPGSLLINDRQIPLFVNTLIESFYELGKPFDIEFPIFYINKKVPTDANIRILKTVGSQFGKEGGAEDKPAFCIQHKNVQGIYESVTLLLSDKIYKNSGQVESDFIKVRTFPHPHKEQTAFAFYAPRIIDDSYICEKTPLFRNTPYEKPWNLLWRIAHPDIRFDTILDGISDYNELAQKKYDKQEYEYHVKRTFLILANYFYSHHLAWQLKENIEKEYGVEADSLRLDLIDLAYLVGHSLAGILSRYLMKEMREAPCKLPLIFMQRTEINKNIPPTYSYGYEQANSRTLPKCQYVSEMLSNIFYNMHTHVEMESRKNLEENLARLRFGESFSSLYYRAYIAGMPETKFVNLHRGMDYRIDSGSVVPKYACVKNGDNRVWLRLFRCGENEDNLLQQQLNFIRWIIGLIENKYGNSILPEELIKTILTLVLCPPDGKEDVFFQNKLPWDYKAKRTEWGLEAAFINESGEETTLFNYCVDFGLLENKYLDGYTLTQSSASEAAIPQWYEAAKAKLENCIYAFVVLTRNQQIPLVDIIEWLYYRDEEILEFVQKTKDWCKTYEQLPEDYSVKSSFVTDFDNIHMAFPANENFMHTIIDTFSGKGEITIAEWLSDKIKKWEQAPRFKHYREFCQSVYYLLFVIVLKDDKQKNLFVERYAKQLDKLLQNKTMKTMIKHPENSDVAMVYKNALNTIEKKVDAYLI